MSREDIEECVKWFDSLVPGAARLHDMTWCVRNQGPRPTLELQGRECCSCQHFVMKGGVCDPL